MKERANPFSDWPWLSWWNCCPQRHRRTILFLGHDMSWGFGLAAWFLLRVREVPGSIPGIPRWTTGVLDSRHEFDVILFVFVWHKQFQAGLDLFVCTGISIQFLKVWCRFFSYDLQQRQSIQQETDSSKSCNWGVAQLWEFWPPCPEFCCSHAHPQTFTFKLTKEAFIIWVRHSHSGTGKL